MDKHGGMFPTGERPESGEPEDTSVWSVFDRDKDTAGTTDIDAPREKRNKEATEKAAREKQQREEKKREEEEAKKDKQDKEDEKRDQEQQESRQQQRRRSVEKSRRIIRNLSDHEHRALSPLETVQLVVAERIAQLGSQIDSDEPLDEHDLRAIERQFDFFSLLSDKLEDPERDIPPEIEAVYQQILIAVTETDDEPAEQTVVTPEQGGHPTDLLAIIAEQFIQQPDPASDGPVVPVRRPAPETPPYHDSGDGTFVAPTIAPSSSRPSQERPTIEHPDTPTEHAEHDSTRQQTTTLALAIAALAYIYRKKRRQATEDTPDDKPTKSALTSSNAGGAMGVGGISAASIHRPEASSAISPTQSTDRQYATHTEHAVQTRTPRADTTPVVHSTDTNPAEYVTPRTTPARSESFTQAADTYPSSSMPIQTGVVPTARTAHAQPLSAESRQATPEASHITLPDTPVEAWSLGDMLRAAEGISLGHGQYLRQAYDRGEIDREGLVKVLKDWKKGRNYAPTFDAQRASLARRRAESHEYLREDRTPMANTTSSSLEDSANAVDTADDPHSATAPGLDAQIPTQTPPPKPASTPPPAATPQSAAPSVQPPPRISTVMIVVAIVGTASIVLILLSIVL